LQAGCWFKLICGASYQHLPSIQNLALAYALAGADCIDVAADPAVVAAVKASFSLISALQQNSAGGAQLPLALPTGLPLLMVSFSDGEDPHFRKATFDPALCPPDCARPCEAICPAAAIAFNDPPGVIADRCYGCGRCLPVCPIQHIETVTRATAVSDIAPTLLGQVDAIEIHTQVGRYDDFMALWSAIRPYIHHLSVVSVSCPDQAGVSDYFWQLYEGMQPLSIPLIWQTDGRPMSGDIGKGTTHATLRYAQKVLQTGPPGFVQLAGGTNAHTVAKLGPGLSETADSLVTQLPRADRRAGAEHPTFGGIAYGSFARRLLTPCLDDLAPASTQPASATVNSDVTDSAYALNHANALVNQLMPAVRLAQSLVMPLKTARSSTAAPPLPFLGDSLAAHAVPQKSPSFLSSFE
jgi:Fe-S-cluster-containing hydrogenase component 2